MSIATVSPDPYSVDVDDPILVRINRRLDSRVEELVEVTRRDGTRILIPRDGTLYRLPQRPVEALDDDGEV